MRSHLMRKMSMPCVVGIGLASLLVIAGPAMGAVVLLGWDTRVGTPDTVASSYNAFGIQASNLSIADSSVTATSAALTDRWTLRDWSTSTTLAGAIAGNAYLSFTVAPEPGRTITLIDSISLHFRRTAETLSVRTFALLSSVDGFTDTAVLGSFTETTTDQQTLHPAFGNLNMTNITGPVEFRIYGYDASGVAHGIHIGPHAANPFGEPNTENMTMAVFGIGVIIPEPGTMILFGLGLGLLTVFRMRRTTKSTTA